MPAVVTMLALITSCFVARTPSVPAQAELRRLVTPAEEAFLLEEIARVQPPSRLADLSRFAEQQGRLGGGLGDLLPEQFPSSDALPLPVDAASSLQAALALARQRETNRRALAALRDPYPLAFSGADRPKLDPGTVPPGLHLVLDLSVPVRFLAALRDGRVTRKEAAAIAALPANREMLRHRRTAPGLPEPRPTRETLAELIRRAGSDDPLDRLWVWLDPCNDLGYADLAADPRAWTDFVVRVERMRGVLAAETLRRVAAYAPDDARLDAVFALTVGSLVPVWTTPDMAGLDLAQTKDDWGLLLDEMTGETYHRLELVLCPTTSGGHARTLDELATTSTGDPGFDRLYEVLAHTALEGAADLARGARPAFTRREQVQAGTALLDEFVATVVENGDTAQAGALLERGLRNDGPLHAVGFALAGAIATVQGPRAVGRALESGPVAFVLAAVSSPRGAVLLTPRTTAAVRRLNETLAAAAEARQLLMLSGPLSTIGLPR